MPIGPEDTANAVRELTLAERVNSLMNELQLEQRAHQKTRTAMLQFFDYFLSTVHNHDQVHKIIAGLTGEEQMERPRLADR